MTVEVRAFGATRRSLRESVASDRGERLARAGECAADFSSAAMGAIECTGEIPLGDSARRGDRLAAMPAAREF